MKVGGEIFQVCEVDPQAGLVFGRFVQGCWGMALANGRVLETNLVRGE